MTQVTYVVDSRGAKYQLGRCLGEGGQGAVYAVKGGRFAAKLLSPGLRTDPKRLERQLLFVRSLDLVGIPIAQPEAVLVQPQSGYIMRVLTDMGPLKQLMVPPPEAVSVKRWYLDTGGLRRRLRLCGLAARAIAMLHAKGLCYGDVSPTNVFVSNSPTADTVCLIDADNLRFESLPSNQPLYTPGYGAPEVVAGRGLVSTLTDAHAIAVVAFTTLALVHPLLGDLVENGDPDLEEQAMLGKLPWIDHASDPANRSSRGISRDVVLSKVLRDLASQTFSQGLSDPGKRCSASEWAEALDRASRNCLVCGACKETFYRYLEMCPWCGAPRAPFLYGRFYIWDPELDGGAGGYVAGPDRQAQVVDSFVLAPGDQLLVDHALGAGASPGQRTEGLFSVGFSGATVTLQRCDKGAVLELRKSGRRRTLTDDPMPVRADKEMEKATLHIGDSERVHRVLGLCVK